MAQQHHHENLCISALNQRGLLCLAHAWCGAEEPEEAAELTDKQVGDFFDYMDECVKGKEDQLVRLLNSVAYPADMSQLLVCINMGGPQKLNSIAKSKSCMNVFLSWIQVQFSLLSTLQSAFGAGIVYCSSHAAYIRLY